MSAWPSDEQGGILIVLDNMTEIFHRRQWSSVGVKMLLYVDAGCAQKAMGRLSISEPAYHTLFVGFSLPVAAVSL